MPANSPLPTHPARVGEPRPRVLYLTHRVPYPPDKGDRIRNFHLLRQLATRSRVWLACLADEPVSDETRQTLESLCERVAFVPVSRFGRWARAAISFARGRSLSEGAFHEPALRRVLREWVENEPFAVSVASASSVAAYLRRDGLESTPAVVDVMDVDSQKWFDFADRVRGPKKWLYQFEGARVRRLERELPRWTRAISLVSRAEADTFDAIAGPGTATAAANGVDLDFFRPMDMPEQSACAFVGALDYLPNVDAAVWFAQEVWPTIRSRFPDCEFWLVGRKPTPEVQRLAALPGIKLIGQVPDVRPYLAAAAIAVVPLRLARGLQNKVLEAMAMGRATVAAPAALAALKTVPGEHVLAATTPDEWVATIGSLLGDPARRAELGTAGRRFVEQNHDWEVCLQPLLDKIFGKQTERPI